MEITLPLALLAGVVSFASPGFLPIVPAFVGQLIGAVPGASVSKRTALATTCSFVAGFSLVFIAVWASIGLIGRSLGPQMGVARVIGGAVLIVMGLHVAGLIDIGLLNRMLRLPMPVSARSTAAQVSARELVPAPPTAAERINGNPDPGASAHSPESHWDRVGAKTPIASAGVLRSALMGVIFGAGWTPCIGPVLGGILALATVSSTSGRGIALMLAYCLGLGLPLVLVGLGVVRINGRILWFTRHEAAISLVSGGLLVVIGFLMITNLFAKLAGIIPGLGI